MIAADALAPLPWRRILVSSLASTAAVVLLVVAAAVSRGGIEVVLRAGETGPGARVILTDFPDAQLLPNQSGHDGQHFYVLARALPNLPDARDDLCCRPGYRAQRIALPLLARALHPASGGGEPLVYALVAANAIGILAGAIGISVLAADRGGIRWIGALYPWLPPCIEGLQNTFSDSFATGLALAAIAAAARRRPLLTALFASAALLGKEATAVLFVGWAIHALRSHLGLRSLLPFVAAGGVAATWFVLLLVILPGPRLHGGEFVVPGTGLAQAITATLHQAPTSSWFTLVAAGATFAGLVMVALLWARDPLCRWMAIALASYQSTLTASYWYNTLDGMRFTVAGMGVLLVVAGRTARREQDRPVTIASA